MRTLQQIMTLHSMHPNKTKRGGMSSRTGPLRFDGTCVNCGLSAWGTPLSFDYDSKLAKPCSKSQGRKG